MKKLQILGERQSGKSTMLVESMFVHLTDESLRKDLIMVASSHNKIAIRHLKKALINKLAANKLEVNVVEKENLIQVGDRTCLFLDPTPGAFIGRSFDYVFLDNADFLGNNFLNFIDMIVRPYAVVIQTQDIKSFFNQKV